MKKSLSYLFIVSLFTLPITAFGIENQDTTKTFTTKKIEPKSAATFLFGFAKQYVVSSWKQFKHSPFSFAIAWKASGLIAAQVQTQIPEEEFLLPIAQTGIKTLLVGLAVGCLAYKTIYCKLATLQLEKRSIDAALKVIKKIRKIIYPGKNETPYVLKLV